MLWNINVIDISREEFDNAEARATTDLTHCSSHIDFQKSP